MASCGLLVAHDIDAEVPNVLARFVALFDQEPVPFLVKAVQLSDSRGYNHEVAEERRVVRGSLTDRGESLSEFRNDKEVLLTNLLHISEGHALLVFVQDLSALAQLSTHDLVVEGHSAGVVWRDLVESMNNNRVDPRLFV